VKGSKVKVTGCQKPAWWAWPRISKLHAARSNSKDGRISCRRRHLACLIKSETTRCRQGRDKAEAVVKLFGKEIQRHGQKRRTRQSSNIWLQLISQEYAARNTNNESSLPHSFCFRANVDADVCNKTTAFEVPRRKETVSVTGDNVINPFNRSKCDASFRSVDC